jgi:nitroreductase
MTPGRRRHTGGVKNRQAVSTIAASRIHYSALDGRRRGRLAWIRPSPVSTAGLPLAPAIYLAVVSKREVRDYAARPLGADAARRILEAGRIAGSSKNRQARRLLVLRSPTLVERAAEAVYAPSNLRGAALVVAIVTRGKGPLAFDAGRAAQNMMLAAWNEGIGSCPNGVGDPERMRDVLELAADEQVTTVLTFGCPARPRDPERRSAAGWIARADRLPFEGVVEER